MNKRDVIATTIIVALAITMGVMINDRINYDGGGWHSKDYKEVMGVSFMYFPKGNTIDIYNGNPYPVSVIEYNISNGTLTCLWNKTLPPEGQGRIQYHYRVTNVSENYIWCICDGTHAEVVRYGWWE